MSHSSRTKMSFEKEMLGSPRRALSSISRTEDSMRRRIAALRITLFLLALSASAAAAPAPAPTPSGPAPKVVTESSAVTAIEIPVNVIGRDGKPVPGLKADDFELYDQGKRQEISAVDVVDLRSAPPADAPAIARRHWLIVLSYTSPKGLALARAAARDFITHATTETDLVGVATVSAESGWRLLANF